MTAMTPDYNFSEFKNFMNEKTDIMNRITHIINELHFILDHIDGDASRNDRDNLRLICPNCDSQLPTYKSRNKNSARTFRKISKE